MKRHLRVEMKGSSEDEVGLLHRFRNFGEDVWRDLKDECDVSLDEIDAAKNVFFVRNLPKRLGRVAANRVRKIAKEHMMQHLIEVTEFASAKIASGWCE